MSRLEEMKEEFKSDLENGLDHAEWYELEFKYLFNRVEELEGEKEQLEADVNVLENKYVHEIKVENKRYKQALEKLLVRPGSYHVMKIVSKALEADKP